MAVLNVFEGMASGVLHQPCLSAPSGRVQLPHHPCSSLDHRPIQIEVWAATLAARQKSGEAKIDRKGNLQDKESRLVGPSGLLECYWLALMGAQA